MQAGTNSNLNIPAEDPAAPGPLIHTISGDIRGEHADGYDAYRGIPYAIPPVGKRRFLPPAALPPWSGVRDARRFGARSLQPRDPEHPFAQAGYGEDCLYLNVLAPQGLKADEQVPVVVFFHGGGHYAGSGIEEFLDAPFLLGEEKLIFVSINYRLGALGYLYLGDLLGERYACSGSLGLLDQLAALRWVQEHIAAFGGDKNRVMLMGISAGAKSICAVLACPQARGLFHGALIQSGGVQCIRDEGTASEITARFLTLAGLSGQDGRRLLDMDGEEIIRVQNLLCQQLYNNHVFGPVAGKGPLPADFAAYLSSGALKGMPVLAGFSREELYPALSEGESAPAATEVKEEWIRVFGANFDHVMAVYQAYLSSGMPYQKAFYQCMSDYVYRNPGKRFARLLAAGGARVWAYQWAHPVDGYARHGSEMDYLFGRVEGDERVLGEQIASLWRHFLVTGMGQAPGLPEWRRLDQANPTRLELDTVFSLSPLEREEVDMRMPLQALILGSDKGC